MITESNHLDPVALGQLLDESLSDAERDCAETHLESCAACGKRLAELAGDGRWWNAASTYLASNADVQHVGLDESGTRVAGEYDELQSWLAPTDDPRMLGRIGTYEVTGVIGSGGMGIVVKAFDVSLNRYVAIKLLRPSLAASKTARQRFAREGQAAASVLHENVIAIHGVAESDRLPYLVMPYVRGESLGSRIKRTGPLRLEEILRIGSQTAGGLSAAHAQGLIHRDVKPSNILLESGVERLKLTDFGLARAADDVGITRTGTIAGTPEYMSPEQAAGEVIDERSDLFSLGSVLWTLSTGRPPFVADSTYGVIRKIIELEPHPITTINPSMPLWFERLVQRLMEKRAEDRFQHADHVETLLRQSLAHVQNAAVPLPAELTPTKTRKRIIAITLSLASFALLLVAAMAVSGSFGSTSGEVNQPNTIDVQNRASVATRTFDDRLLNEPALNEPAVNEPAVDEPVVDEPIARWKDGTDDALRSVRIRLERLRDETR